MATKKKKTVDFSEGMNDDDLTLALASEINSLLKEDTIMVGDNGGDDTNVPYWVITGIPQLDYAVGGYSHPGFPGARFIEIFGNEGCGKSTLAVWLMKQAIEQVNAVAYYQDAERVLTPEIIRGTGINMKRVMRDQPDTLEQAFQTQEIALQAIASKCPDKPVVTILDSIAACSTQAEIEGDMEAMTVGSAARVMSKGLRKIKSFVTDTSVLSIFVNQVREKIGISYGDKTASAGGKALPYYASVRVQLARTSYIKDKNGTPIGATIKATVKKNKVAPPMKVAEYNINFVQTATGSYPQIDCNMAVLDWLEENGLIEGKGGRVTIRGKSIYKKEAVKLMEEDEELRKELVAYAYSVKLDNPDEANEAILETTNEVADVDVELEEE